MLEFNGISIPFHAIESIQINVKETKSRLVYTLYGDEVFIYTTTNEGYRNLRTYTSKEKEAEEINTSLHFGGDTSYENKVLFEVLENNPREIVTIDSLTVSLEVKTLSNNSYTVKKLVYQDTLNEDATLSPHGKTKEEVEQELTELKNTLLKNTNQSPL